MPQTESPHGKPEDADRTGFVLEVGKEYQTYDGRTIRVLHIRNDSKATEPAVVLDTEDDTIRTYSKNGQYVIWAGPSIMDIVPPPPPLPKTMKEAEDLLAYKLVRSDSDLLYFQLEGHLLMFTPRNGRLMFAPRQPIAGIPKEYIGKVKITVE